MTAREQWRKSSHTGGSGNCVEIAWPTDRTAGRDSKQPTGPTLSFPVPAWHAFLTEKINGSD